MLKKSSALLAAITLLSSASYCLAAAAPAATAAVSAAGTTSATAPPAHRTIPGRPVFSATAPGPVNRKAVQAVHFHMPAPYNTPLYLDSVDNNAAIMGPAEATQEQMAAFIRRRNPQPKLNCTIEQIVSYYYAEAGREGIRPDVALCQALKETGFFGYGGDVSPRQNNFCGLGATGNHVAGASFATPELGVRAHIQHLLAYASLTRPSQSIVDPRYDHVCSIASIHGRITQWTGLNGVWAVPGKHYGEDILNLWQQAQAPDGSDASLDAANKRINHAPDESANFLYRGIVYYQRADYEHAAQDFTTAYQLSSEKSTEALYNRALTNAARGDKRAARRDYDAVIAQAPELPQAVFNRGLLLLQDRKYAASISDMERALELIPELAPARNAIGLAHIAERKYDLAWSDFAQAATLNSANMDVLANQIILEACLK